MLDSLSEYMGITSQPLHRLLWRLGLVFVVAGGVMTFGSIFLAASLRGWIALRPADIYWVLQVIFTVLLVSAVLWLVVGTYQDGIAFDTQYSEEIVRHFKLPCVVLIGLFLFGDSGSVPEDLVLLVAGLALTASGVLTIRARLT